MPPAPAVTTPEEPSARGRAGWTLAIVSVALFMTSLDNLVVGVALPRIRTDLGGSLEALQWTVNAYTLAFAVLLITGAALGDRFGRKRMFIAGLGVFTLASAAAAVSVDIGTLIAARAVQGAGAAMVTPLTLTLLAETFPGARRGLALGVWAGVSGLGVALGPAVGGAVVQSISWHWIFWLNVPTGVVAMTLAARLLAESHGPEGRLDIPGLALVATGLLGVTFGIVRGQELGWTSPTVLTALIGGSVLVAAFLAWEHRAPAPMLPLRFFASRGFSATGVVSFSMFFGVFGAIFLLAQFFQTAQGYGPLEAGLRTLPWTAMPMFVAPVAGILSDRIGSRPLMATGLGLQAVAIGWLARVSAVDVAYSALLIPFVLGGTGMALVFAPAANATLQSVRPEEAGQASGATNAIRELGGVMGVAVLASVFAANGGYQSPQTFVEGLTAALPYATVVLAVGAVAALFVPGHGAGTQDPELGDALPPVDGGVNVDVDARTLTPA